MDQRPANLIYSLDEKPPLDLNFFLSLQHVALGLMYIVYPVLLMQEMGAGLKETQGLVSCCILCIGLATLMQTLRRGPVGSGYLAVQVTNPIFLPVSLEAARIGGLALVWGMTLFSGVFQSLFSQIFSRLRAIFTPEVCGVVISMLGVSMVGVSVSRFAGIVVSGEPVDFQNILVASITLGIMFGITIWFRGTLRLFSLIIGFLFGYAVSYALGIADLTQLAGIKDMPVVAIPEVHVPKLSFDWFLALPFLITGIVSSIDTAAGIITCQKFNEAAWRRPEMQSVSRGILADGLGNISAGLLSAFGIGVSSANLGLCMATGATSRRVGVLAGFMFIGLAFFPKASLSLSLIPLPVMGAVLVYVSSFLIVSGMQLIMSRMLDDRGIAMVGLSFVAGLSVEITPHLYGQLPAWSKPFFGSSLAAAAVTAIALNAIFRLGTSKRATLVLQPGEDTTDALYRFLEDLGAGWGARRDVISMANLALVETVETIGPGCKGPLRILATFDEYNLNITVTYRGEPFCFYDERPSVEEILEDEGAVARLSGFLVNQYADKVQVTREEEVCKVLLHFEH